MPSARCADHPALGRWLRQRPTGRLVLDKTEIAAEERLDGKYLLSTSDPHLSAEDVALGYKNLLEAERGFRDLQSTLKLRPVFHRLKPRIGAHVLLCWLALLLIRVERRTVLTWRRIALELGRLHAVTLQGAAGTVAQTTEPTDAQVGILRACGVLPVAPRHGHKARLTPANSLAGAAQGRRYTRHKCASAHQCRSGPTCAPSVCPPTAEAGRRCRPRGGAPETGGKC